MALILHPDGLLFIFPPLHFLPIRRQTWTVTRVQKHDVITFGRINLALKFPIPNDEKTNVDQIVLMWAKKQKAAENALFQEGRVDPKSDGYVAGYKNKKSADAKMRPS